VTDSIPAGSDPSPPDGARRPWALVLLAALLAAGTAICVYLTRFHENALYGDASVTLANCPRTETTNCEVVNTSEDSELGGVPISALGIPTYLLLLGLTILARRRPRLLGFILAIGLLTSLYSAYLFYVSKVRIGFLCVWCFRLYCINVGIPILAGLASGRNPFRHLREALEDLRALGPQVRRSAAAFAGLLALTVAGDRIYRAGLTRAEPPAPTTAEAPGRAAEAPGTAAVAPGTAFVVSVPVKELRGRGGSLEEQPFDLQTHVGKGRPMALLFWAPGYPIAESALATFARFLKEQAPRYELFAVAGKRDDQRVEMVWERFCMLDLPPDLPLLLDEGFALYKQLGLTDVPDLVLVDGAGILVTARLKGLKEVIARGAQSLTAEELIRRVEQGVPTAPIGTLPPYYPASALYGQCAPEFTLPELGTGRDVRFGGRSANGKPTFLVFWSATCKHCQKEIPQLIRHVRAHPGEINVVSVALVKPDRPDGFSHRRVTEAYVRTNGMVWPVLDDSSGLAEDLYAVVSTPTTFLISPGGEVVDAWYYVHENLDQAIARELPRLHDSGGPCTPVAPDRAPRASFSAIGPDGVKVSLDALIDRPALVHLWATWCVPCQTELPALLKFRGALEALGGRLVLVSVEDAQAGDRIRAYGSRLDPGFRSLRAPEGGLADRLNLGYQVPRTYLVARGGRVLRTYYGAQPWEDPSFQESVRTLLQLRRN